MSHTPTPWAMKTSALTSITYLTYEGRLVFEKKLIGHDDVAVKLNAHDELVAALTECELVLGDLPSTSLTGTRTRAAFDAARAALAKVQQ